MIDCQKHLFSLPEDVHYLNTAYMAPLSRRVEEAGVAAVRRKSRPYTITARDFFADVDRARALFAKLIGAPDPSQVAVIPSASYGLAQAARNTPVRAGQSIVTVAEEFPSNVYIWRRLAAESGAVLREVAVRDADREPESWTEAVLDAIDDSTAIVTLARLSWADGTLLDLPRIGARAREHGAAFFVDGSQSVGAEPFDVTQVRPDALVCPTYKWLMGPYSVGFAWFSTRFNSGVPIEENWITREGSENFAGLVRYTDRYRPGAMRYDVGETSNFALMPMAVAALEQVLEWTPTAIQAYARELTRDLAGTLRDAGYRIAPEAGRAGHLFGLRLPPGTDPEELRGRLERQRVFVSVRGDAVRVSAHLFNDARDVQALERALLSLRSD